MNFSLIVRLDLKGLKGTKHPFSLPEVLPKHNHKLSLSRFSILTDWWSSYWTQKDGITCKTLMAVAVVKPGGFMPPPHPIPLFRGKDLIFRERIPRDFPWKNGPSGPLQLSAPPLKLTFGPSPHFQVRFYAAGDVCFPTSIPKSVLPMIIQRIILVILFKMLFNGLKTLNIQWPLCVLWSWSVSLSIWFIFSEISFCF